MSAIDAYVAALETQDYKEAYRLMSTAYKREHAQAEFVKMMQENPDDAMATAARLRTAKQVSVSAELTYGRLDDPLGLVLEGPAWRIDHDPIDFYPQTTPRVALRAFLRAVINRRYHVVLRFVPNEYRKSMNVDHVRSEFEGESKAHNAEVLELLRRRLKSPRPLEVEGDTARMAFGDRYEVKLLREDGVWKVEDLY